MLSQCKSTKMPQQFLHLPRFAPNRQGEEKNCFGYHTFGSSGQSGVPFSRQTVDMENKGGIVGIQNKTAFSVFYSIKSSCFVLYFYHTTLVLFNNRPSTKGSPDCSRLPNILSRVVPFFPLPVLHKSFLT